MIDCHSFFDVEQSVAVAGRLEPYNLTWYEEPVPPERVDDTVTIRHRIKQQMAGGEVLFGLSGFAPLIGRRAVDTIMPDVKHCGGLLQMTRIAAVAADAGVMVAPAQPEWSDIHSRQRAGVRGDEERQLPRASVRRSRLAVGRAHSVGTIRPRDDRDSRPPRIRCGTE